MDNSLYSKPNGGDDSFGVNPVVAKLKLLENKLNSLEEKSDKYNHLSSLYNSQFLPVTTILITYYRRYIIGKHPDEADDANP